MIKFALCGKVTRIRYTAKVFLLILAVVRVDAYLSY